jgi:hypothetical protein
MTECKGSGWYEMIKADRNDCMFLWFPKYMNSNSSAAELL